MKSTDQRYDQNEEKKVFRFKVWKGKKVKTKVSGCKFSFTLTGLTNNKFERMQVNADKGDRRRRHKKSVIKRCASIYLFLTLKDGEKQKI